MDLGPYLFCPQIHPFLSALDCLEDPATGPSRTWPEEAIFYGTTITYECPYGKHMEVVVDTKLD